MAANEDEDPLSSFLKRLMEPLSWLEKSNRLATPPSQPSALGRVVSLILVIVLVLIALLIIASLRGSS